MDAPETLQFMGNLGFLTKKSLLHALDPLQCGSKCCENDGLGFVLHH